MNSAILIDQVQKEYPGVHALSSVSLEVQQGEIHGLLGPNGAGKSTLMKILSGLTVATAGTVKINGTIGYLPELPPLYLDMSVQDYLIFVAKIFRPRLPQKSIKEQIDLSLKQMGLTGVANRRIGNLSNGMKQRVGLAGVLVQDPDIFILDEPTVGLDPVSLKEIRDFIQSLRGKKTVLLSTHLLNEVEQICSHISIMNEGKVLFTGTREAAVERVRPQQVFIALVNQWNSEQQHYFEQLSFVHQLEVTKNLTTQEWQLKFFVSTEGDHRFPLTQHLMNQNCGLLSFAAEEMHLEDVFFKVTQNFMVANNSGHQGASSTCSVR